MKQGFLQIFVLNKSQSNVSINNISRLIINTCLENNELILNWIIMKVKKTKTKEKRERIFAMISLHLSTF